MYIYTYNIALHYITLHYITLHYNTIQYNTIHYTFMCMYVYIYIYINTVYVLYLGILFSLEFDDPIGPSNILGSASTA